MYLCTSGSNRDTISYFPIYMKHCTVSQANNDDHTLYSAPAVVDHYVPFMFVAILNMWICLFLLAVHRN